MKKTFAFQLLRSKSRIRSITIHGIRMVSIGLETPYGWCCDSGASVPLLHTAAALPRGPGRVVKLRPHGLRVAGHSSQQKPLLCREMGSMCQSWSSLFFLSLSLSL